MLMHAHARANAPKKSEELRSMLQDAQPKPELILHLAFDPLHIAYALTSSLLL